MVTSCYNKIVISMIDKKRGFTLIELLCVVVILGVIGVIITISFTNTLRNSNQKECTDFVTEVEEAACVYVSLSNSEVVCSRNTGCDVSLNYLVKEGLISSENDKCTNNDIDLTETVSVRWDSTTGEKICTYNGVKEYAR